VSDTTQFIFCVFCGSVAMSLITISVQLIVYLPRIAKYLGEKK
jgi:hypothetical protein